MQDLELPFRQGLICGTEEAHTETVLTEGDVPAEEKDECLRMMKERGCFARTVGNITGELDTVLTEVR